MKTNFNPNQPIKAFINQIGDCIALAVATNAPSTPAQIIAIAYNIIFSTGMHAMDGNATPFPNKKPRPISKSNLLLPINNFVTANSPLIKLATSPPTASLMPLPHSTSTKKQP
jgi:hypothetical protein